MMGTVCACVHTCVGEGGLESRLVVGIGGDR